MRQLFRHLRTASKTTRTVVSLAAFGIAGAAIYLAAVASAAPPGPPAPTITGKPANPTSSTAAGFTYTDSPSVTFQCSLDGGAFASCGSGTSGSKSYSGLAAGSHTFKVHATASSRTSGDTAYTWLVDTSAPSAPALTLSAGGGYAYVTGTTAYYNGTTGSGSSVTVAATASDAQSGIQKVDFPALAGFAGGGDDATSPYDATYTWSSSSASGAKTVTAYNGVGLAGSSSFTLVRDVTAPAGGALTVNGTAATGGGSQSLSSTGSFPINLRTDYAEAQSASQAGLASSVLTRQQAPLGAFSCGGFGSPTTLTGTPAQSGLAEGCYRYTLTGTDRVGNAASISTVVAVDKTAPGLALGFPSNGGLYSASGWNNGCFSTICGGGMDRTGVAQVQLSLQQLSTGKYWNGSSFSSTGQSFVAATVFPAGGQVVVWGVSFPASSFPADGQYRLSVRGTDLAGNTTSPGSYLVATFTIDRTPPPAPAITQHPPVTDSSKNAHFSFTDSEQGVSFRCQLDGGGYGGCNGSSGNANYNNLSDGEHQFCVEAVDQAGNVSSPTCFQWAVHSFLSFTIAGSPLAGVLLYPGGPAVPINLVFTNPNTSPIMVQSVTVSVTGTSAAGCGPANFTVAQQLTATPTVPASSTESLQDLGVPQSQWPQLQMVDTGNQDACKNATVNLSYSGQARG